MCWLATRSSFEGKGHRKKKRKRWVHWNVFVLWDISLAFRALAGLPQRACCGLFCFVFFWFVLFFLFFLGVAVSWNKCICILKSCFCQTLNVKQRSVKFDCEVLCSLLEHTLEFFPTTSASCCSYHFPMSTQVNICYEVNREPKGKQVIVNTG